MKQKHNLVALFALGLVVLGAMIYGGVRYSRQGMVTVQTGRALRQDLVAQVTASGEIKPRNYINVGAQYMGMLTEILVKEGDRVKKGQLLAKLDPVQPSADVEAQRAALRTAQADLAAAEASVKSARENLATVRATLARAKADGEKAQINFKRAEQLVAAAVIARQDYDMRKAEYDSAMASIDEAQARVAQTQAALDQTLAQQESTRRRVDQMNAMLTRLSDVLQKYYSIAPLDGVVTNLPVRVGETVVPGIQNSAASLIMTIADMSLITAEVKVDETDIVNVKQDQPAQISIDAMPSRTFHGHVIEIGNEAILRTSGLAASQSTTSTQEAKDFKVVVAMDDPPAEIRPGLSCTAKITTATRSRALTIPIQALTIRTAEDLEPDKKPGQVAHAADQADALTAAGRRIQKKEEIQGVFVVADKKVVFRPVTTGITGASDIEVLGGLNDNDEIITGSYKVLRTIRPQATVKIDNSAPKREEEK